MRQTAEQVANKLREVGFTVGKVVEPSLELDGEVALHNNLFVQVGFDYVMLCRYGYKNGELDSVEYIHNNTSVENIITYLTCHEPQVQPPAS